jgi:spore coat-associated protein N
MSQRHHTTKSENRRQGRAVFAGIFAVSVGLLTTAGVYAALSGVATGTEAVTSGTLNLTLSADVGAGFSNFVGKMAPGDTDNVYVNLNNTGTLASAAGMTLWVAGSPVNALTNGSAPGEGLTVTATQCSVAWTLATGVCSGTTTSILATAQISTFNTSGTAVNLLNIPALAASVGQVAHVQVSLGLVGTETSTNGVSPSPTIQGLSTTLTYTFTEQQRAGIATNQ